MTNNVIVEIESGKIQGYENRGVIKFKGIPYAAPPIGELRFKPPVPPDPWDEVRDAKKYGPISPQPASALEAMFNEPLPQSEAECLTLNVWTPALDNKNRSVMFWIHGGGFVTGNGAALDGSRLVLRGNVVVVSINYRLGPLGFLYIPDVEDVSANVGMLDMIAGLKWVKHNITKFGGDPNNVTIFGESAGGMAVSTLLAMPLAKGFFKRAIPHSGVAHPLGSRPTLGIQTYEQYLKKLNVEKGDIDKLREIPAEELMKVQEAEAAVSSGEFFASEGLRLTPIIDGKTLPEHPLDAIRNGYAKDIDIFVGVNKDETKLWNMWNPKADNLDDTILFKGTNRIIGLTRKGEDTTREMIKIYEKTRNTPRDVMDAISTDYMFRIPSIRLAEAQCNHQPNTYMYLFTWKSTMSGGKYGAMHALELPFVFGLLTKEEIGIFPQRTKETEALSNDMMDCWINFARSGNPNHENIPLLPSYDLERRSTILFNTNITIESDPMSDERRAWEEIM